LLPDPGLLSLHFRKETSVSEENKARTREFYEGINSRDYGVLDRLVADDFVDHEEVPGIPNTREGVRMFFDTMHNAFSGFHINVEDVIAEGDKVVVRGTIQGTHTGDFLGIPASNKQVNVPVIDIIRVRDGKAIEHWGVTDMGALMAQMGVAPPPA
jgi:steroid delta-isomerase-like uncharacterized protein